MNAIEMLMPLIDDPAGRAIGWALVHFVWQGALVGVLAAAALALLRNSDADVRYVVATIALAVMATLPVVTAVQTYDAATAAVTPALEVTAPVAQQEAPAASVVEASAAPTAPPQPAVPPSAFADRSFERWMPMFVLVWMAGVGVLTLRLFSGWLWVQRMKSHGARLASRELQASVARLSKRLHISRPVKLLESSGVDVPTVIGCIKPVILLPVSALAGLSHLQVEAILAHELAHIRRHDYFVNLLQTLLETLLFYHPAVWWLSRRIRAEREHCCDDLAVSLCGDPVAYARALADLEELRGTTGRLVMAASGGPLLRRVRRLLLAGPANHDGRGPVWLAGATALLLVVGVGGVAISGASAHRDGLSAGFVEQYPPIPPPPPVPPPPPPQVPPSPDYAALARLLESESLAGSIKGMAHLVNEITEFARQSEDALRVLARIDLEPQAAAPPPPPPPGQPEGPSVAISRQSSGDNHISWSNNGEKLEIRWNGEFEFSDDDTDIIRMSPGSRIRISDGGWFQGRSVEFTTDASGQVTRKYWVGSTERPYDPEGRQWLAQRLPRFIRQSGMGAAGRVARFYKSQGVNGVLAEISKIEGSWGKKRYITELLKLNISADDRRRALEQAGREISSDYEMASLLIDNAEAFFADAGTRKAYFDATRNIESDYELRRVLGAGLKRGPLDTALLAALLDTSQSIDSDYELASLLIAVAKQQSIEQVRASYFAALASVSSDYEHGRVLSTLGARSDISPETLTAMLASMTAVSSDHEASNFLQKIAKQGVTDAQRVAFFGAVDAMKSDYERGRALLGVANQPQMSTDTMLALLKSVKGMSSSYEASRILQTLAAKHAITGAARDAYIDATERLGDYEQGRALSALVKSDRARK